MNYIEAAAIVADYAPGLILDPDHGQIHVNLRKSKDSAPFSIILPSSTEDMPIEPEEEVAMFKACLDAAMKHLG